MHEPYNTVRCATDSTNNSKTTHDVTVLSQGNYLRLLVMEEDQQRVARLQRKVANDVVIEKYDFLVGCIDAVRLFPYLVSSKVVQQDFRQYLDGERTDKDKMMALLRELTRSPMDGWFNEFVGALSKVPQYQALAAILVEGNKGWGCTRS